MDFIKYAFSAGEISEKLLGRTDLEKYDFGVALAYNFFVDYQGGLSTRPGSEFGEWIWKDDLNIRLFEFQFAPEVRDTYAIIFGDNYIRFLQDNVYILEDEVNITDISQEPYPVITTATPHGYSVGDWIKIFDVVGPEQLNTRLVEVRSTTSNTIEMEDPQGQVMNTQFMPAYVSGGVVQRVYTLTSPYDSDSLPGLRVEQRRNLVRITSFDHPTRNLIRNDHDDWDLELEDLGNTVEIPDAPTLNPSGSGDAGTLVAVTAVSVSGEESLSSDMTIEDSMIDYAVTRGSLRMSWPVLDDVAYYNVYRGNIVPQGTDVSKAMQLGYLGSSVGPSFVDNNIIPDFTVSPPQHYNPFANGSIEYINVTSFGSGYSKGTDISISDPNGSGFRGAVIVNESGQIIGVQVISGGENYTSPTINLTNTGGGSGAAFTIILGPQLGNYPSVSATFQKRQIYAATLNQPLTVWGSRPEQPSNFDISAIVTPSDSYEFDVESGLVSPIKHLVPLRTGMLIFTSVGVWNLNAGGEAVGPTQALADPQSYQGCSDVPPIQVDADLLYISGRGTVVRLLSYNDIFKVFSGQDMSILASHFFTESKQVTSWSFAQEPYRIVWGTRSDGAMLNFTIVKEQNVFAWTQLWTKGFYEETISLQEGIYDRVYAIISRNIQGRWRKFVERFALRDFEHTEDAVCVDAALSLFKTFPNAAVQVDTLDEFNRSSVFADAAVFSSNDMGKVIRSNGGKGTVQAVYNSSQILVNWLRLPEEVIPETETFQTKFPGEWTLDEPRTFISGLWHLEGEEVWGLADGNVVGPLVVDGGAVELPHAATRVTLGLPYKCIAQTLPPTSRQIVLENKRKNIFAAWGRFNRTRGLAFGTDLDNLWEIRERTTEAPGEPVVEINGIKGVLINSTWDTNGQTYIVQKYPLPSSILGLVIEGEVGDVED